tara:strand:+ start:10745 stop:11260 length:516 start_codon:yes stop_codon:yes gene_type:complete
MKYKSFLNKLFKRLGTKVLPITSDDPHKKRRKEWLIYEDTVASWYVEPSDWEDENSAPSVSSFHTKAVGQESDPHTDYFPGTFWSNGTQLIDRLKSPPPKYPVGSLVRGKSNKRAIRCGYDNAVGIVLSCSGKYLEIHFSGGENSSWLNETVGWRGRSRYPERDFELVNGK